MKKVVCLIPFYGSWPNFTSLFLESCRGNEWMDFIFLTDLDPIENSPQNVLFHKISFVELCALINKKIGVEIAQIRPYKLCDFRPAYGVIFEELIQTYDFWGYCDMDLVFGKLNRFLTSDVLEQHDLICFRNDHLHGPFTLYKNSKTVNNLFKRSETYADIFTTDQYLSFDEFGMSHFHLHPEKDITEFPNDNISVIALKANKNGELSVGLLGHSKEIICDDNTVIKVNNGEVTNAKTAEQYAFYHWVIEKRAIWFKYPEWTNIPATYIISKSGFYSENESKRYQLIHSMRITFGFFRWTGLKFSNYIKRRLHLSVTIDTYPRVGFIKHLS